MVMKAKNLLSVALAGCCAAAIAAEAKRDLVIVGGTVEAVEAAIQAKQAGRSVLLLAPRGYLGEDVAGTMRGVDAKTTPLDLKRTLDERMLAADVEFRTWAPVTAVAADGVTVTTRLCERSAPGVCESRSQVLASR